MKKIYFIIISFLGFFSFKSEAQSNTFTINAKVSDTNGNLIINYPVTVYRDNQVFMLLTDSSGIATDVSEIKSNIPQEDKVSVEDPCTPNPLTQIVKPFPGTVNLSFTICTKIDTSKNCKVKYEVLGSNSNSSTFTFNAIPNISGANYFWSFGDGTYDTGSSVTHTFQTIGTFEVNVKMILNTCTAEYSNKIDIKGITPPPPTTLVCECCATMKLIPGNDKNNFIFSGEAGFKNPEFSWTIDSINLTGQEIKYTFLKPGKYIATMEAKGEMCYVKINKTIIIPDDSTNTGGGNCNIDFTYLIKSPGSLSVYFKALFNTSLQPKLNWSFGDGETSNDLNPVHDYKKPGTYKVTLDVYYSNGKICSITKIIIVQKTKTNGPTASNLKVEDIFPNPPTTSTITLNVHSDFQQQILISIFDSNGNIQKQIPADLNVGDNAIVIDISNLKPGIYVVVVSLNGFKINIQKLIIL